MTGTSHIRSGTYFQSSTATRARLAMKPGAVRSLRRSSTLANSCKHTAVTQTQESAHQRHRPFNACRHLQRVNKLNKACADVGAFSCVAWPPPLFPRSRLSMLAQDAPHHWRCLCKSTPVASRRRGVLTRTPVCHWCPMSRTSAPTSSSRAS